ncbi:hypothetical protein BDY21DRAFT_292582 [Lineolata rhizophorae]|uniref:NAD-dependent epimerase/dehydratase domain-containing protein n=1 Tax=Lineolata rhizophorae TaxID=578093 RepID=A0A6A6NQH1_9PEZI|nr:hypothetical protein BDY21DRAFT_292582 [Lineolata rhizophorae]
MRSELVLITGATGLIGFRTLVFALQAGYRVRAAIRSTSKQPNVEAALSRAGVALEADDQLSFVAVPDLTAAGAYEEAIRGATYVLHIASPSGETPCKTPDDFRDIILGPAVKGTLAMLEAAAGSGAGSVKRVVITSSIAAFVPFENLLGGVATDRVFGPDDRLPMPEAPPGDVFTAYCQSKAMALNEAEAWIARRKPPFSVVHVHPSYTIGRNDLATSTEGYQTTTNHLVMDIVLGGAELNILLASASVHLDDVARIHIGAMTIDLKGSLAGKVENDTTWEDAKDIAAKNFPDAVAKGVLPNTGSQPTLPLMIDSRETEKAFGFKHLSYEEEVKSVIQHYLELASKA